MRLRTELIWLDRPSPTLFMPTCWFIPLRRWVLELSRTMSAEDCNRCQSNTDQLLPCACLLRGTFSLRVSASEDLALVSLCKDTWVELTSLMRWTSTMIQARIPTWTRPASMPLSRKFMDSEIPIENLGLRPRRVGC